jgi:hypothetical protein
MSCYKTFHRITNPLLILRNRLVDNQAGKHRKYCFRDISYF